MLLVLYSHSPSFKQTQLDIEFDVSNCQGIINPCLRLRNTEGVVFQNPQMFLVLYSHVYIEMKYLNIYELKRWIDKSMMDFSVKLILALLITTKKMMIGANNDTFHRYHPDDSYQVGFYKQGSPILLQQLHIMPDEGTCQVIQFIPNITVPKSRFCPIYLNRTQNTPSKIHVNHGRRQCLMTHCPFMVKSARGNVLDFFLQSDKYLKPCTLIHHRNICQTAIYSDSTCLIPDCPNLIYKDFIQSVHINVQATIVYHGI